MPSTVVVTGAGGFVGGYLARYFAKQGHTVFAMSRQIPECKPVDCLLWRSADLCVPNALPNKFDFLIHCAAELPSRTSDPERLYQLNLEMGANVFSQALAVNAKAIIFLSSMSVYGRISVPVVTENLIPDSPDAYGRAKWELEKRLEVAVANGLQSGLSLRLPGTVGKGSHHNFLSDALTRALVGKTVIASNPESLFNNIVYVGDLANFLDQWIANPRFGYEMTNLGSEKPISIRKILSTLFAETKQPERIIFQPAAKPAFLIALDQARSLGYRPATVLDSIANFVNDSRNRTSNFG